METHPLTAFREEHDLTKAALAALLGVSKASITRWENGRRKPDRAALIRIKNKTGIEPRELRPDLVGMLGRGE
jgi:transcriptional regulator with XRE-family HTH domain